MYFLNIFFSALLQFRTRSTRKHERVSGFSTSGKNRKWWELVQQSNEGKKYLCCDCRCKNPVFIVQLVQCSFFPIFDVLETSEISNSGPCTRVPCYSIVCNIKTPLSSCYLIPMLLLVRLTRTTRSILKQRQVTRVLMFIGLVIFPSML